MADHQSNPGAQNSNTTLLQKLASAVHGHAATATFACGGSVPLSALSTAPNVFPSITLRWDFKDSYFKQSKISFPLPHHDDASCNTFDFLLRSCEPATFGVGGRDILDEKYRKAMKLDASDFSTNFHPHDCGILDSVQQILLPSTIGGGQGVGIGPQGVRAELYKLNIYSAPSGKFLSHVDTPRGIMQFGSLVVCLPFQHEGGGLRIKHRGEKVDFAWGHTSQQSVQWAAFYGDCEHEVFEVTKGHRITLTYNLYYSSVGKLAQPVSDPHHLPLFDIAGEMLLQQAFMSKGGILGFFCHHQYAHSQESGRKSIPGAFKGVDLAVFSVFHALGLKVGIHPIIKNESENMGGLSARELMQGPTVPRKGDFVDNCLENLSANYKGEREEKNTIVGTNLHGPTFDENFDQDPTEPVPDTWPHQKIPQIVWMNEAAHKDFALAGLAYGNQAELNYQFSAAAILVVVPPSDVRRVVPEARHTQQEDKAASMTPPSTVVATPASGLSMSIDDPSNASPRSTLGSSLDRVHWPPGPSVADDGVRPGYHNHYDHRYGHATSSDALQVTSVVSESGFEFDSTELIPVRVANEGAPAIDPSLAAMENAMWTSTETEEMGDEDFYEGRMR